MLKSLTRASAALLLAVSFGFSVVPAKADQSGALANGVVSGANTAIRSAMDKQTQSKAATKPQDGTQSTIAQVPPVNQQPVGGAARAGLPTGFTYFADASVAYPWGNIGTANGKWLQGGVDGMASYGFSPTSRVVASYYELQHYPQGFNSGTVPFYLPPGFPNAGCQSLGVNAVGSCPGTNPQLDLTTKDRFLLLSYEQLFLIGNIGGRSLPIVVTPTYVARWSTINQSGNGTDVVPFVNPLNGQPVTGVATRSAQYDSVAVTVPFLKTSRMFGTFTVAPTWLTHLNGVNQTNTAQLYQVLYLEYNVNKSLRLFLEPQSSRDYLPTDPYPEHLAAYFLGATERVGKYGFVQVVLNSGGPTNYSPYGVKYLQCYGLPCSGNTVPAIGGLKATQLQVQFGVGSPVVLPI
ncbi:MAG TPA: hypothetical protein VK702_04235 [Candidatus Acidoferrum sp.]|jgi:hypothetical protein|nr:hypothetical protein [Candidatus Acidoferrum sp.]